MAMRNKRKWIRLQSSKSSHFYVTVKNPVNTTEKLRRNKYDPTIRAVCEYVEEKLK